MTKEEYLSACENVRSDSILGPTNMLVALRKIDEVYIAFLEEENERWKVASKTNKKDYMKGFIELTSQQYRRPILISVAHIKYVEIHETGDVLIYVHNGDDAYEVAEDYDQVKEAIAAAIKEAETGWPSWPYAWPYYPVVPPNPIDWENVEVTCDGSTHTDDERSAIKAAAAWKYLKEHPDDWPGADALVKSAVDVLVLSRLTNTMTPEQARRFIYKYSRQVGKG